jgi:hypothetical protein
MVTIIMNGIGNNDGNECAENDQEDEDLEK